MNEWSIPLAALVITLGALVAKLWTARGGSGVSVDKVWDRIDAIRRELDERIAKVGSDIAKQHARWQEQASANYEREADKFQHQLAEVHVRLNRLEDGLAKRGMEGETIMEFLMRRARVEMLLGGMADKQSPIALTASTIAAITPFITDIIRFYGEQMRQVPALTEGQMFLAIEREFGDRLLEDVCIPYKVHLGACVVAVMDICRARFAAEESHG